MVYSFIKIVSYCFLEHFFFSLGIAPNQVFKVKIATTNKLHFSLDFDITYPSKNALYHSKLRALKYVETQSCNFFDFGIQQKLNILIAK